MMTTRYRLSVLLLLIFANFAQAKAEALSCQGVFVSNREYLQQQVDKFVVEKKDLQPVDGIRSFKVTEATRNELLNDILYKHKLVEASEFSRMMSDKLFQVEFLIKENPAVAPYFPKTLAFSEFLATQKVLKNSNKPKQLKIALQKNFPHGFVVKPTAGYNTGGRGFYINDIAGLTQDLLANPAKFTGNGRPFVSPELNIASGEPFLIQELLTPAGGGRPPEYRVHTFEGRVVKEATESRWLNPEEKNFKAIEDYVQGFLDKVPPAVLQKQAWGLDVVEVAPGNFRIIEINTNRGNEIQWSGYLISSIQLGALARHLEKYQYLTLEGPAAETFRKNKAGLESWIRKEGLEQVIKDLQINHPELANEIQQKYKP